MRSDRRPPLAYLLLVPFLLSGASALVAQLCWLRQLTVGLGGSSAALNIILISFMGGLAGGAALARRLLRHTRRHLLFYACLEFGLSLYMLASPWIIGGVTRLFATLLPSLGHETLFSNLVRLGVAGVALAPPTVAMGLTTPILITASVRRLQETGAQAGLLYGINTLGAAVGSLVSGTWLILSYGVSDSLKIAAALNAIAATIALILSRWLETDSRERRNAPSDEPIVNRALILRYGTIAGLVGFSAMALEVVFARLMTFLIGSSYYSQTISIGGFLLGIVLGSLVIGFVARRRQPREEMLPLLLLGFGGAAILSGLSFERLPMFLQHVLVDSGLGLPALGTKLIAALALVLLPAMMSGMLLPYLIHLLTQRERNVPDATSNIFFFNTVGSVIGVALTGYVLIEGLGVRRTLFVMAALIFGIALFATARIRRVPRGIAVVGMVIAFGLAWLRGAEPLIVHSVAYHQYGQPPVLFYDEDESASVSVTSIPENGGRRLLINSLNAAEVSTGDFRLGATTDMAMLSHPAPRSVFVAGIGSGKNAGVAGIYPDVDVSAVEILSGVIDSLPHFDAFTYDLSTNESVTTVRGDARHFLETTRRTYDVIIPDVFISALTGTAYLYNVEFFELCSRRLAPGGRVAMNIGVTPIDNVISATFLEAFDHVELINPPFSGGAFFFLIGSNDPIEYPVRPWAEWTDPRLIARVSGLGLLYSEGVGDFRILTDGQLRQRLAGQRISTDDHPIVDYLHQVGADGPLVW